jgi:hypothetical protein
MVKVGLPMYWVVLLFLFAVSEIVGARSGAQLRDYERDARLVFQGSREGKRLSETRLLSWARPES